MTITSSPSALRHSVALAIIVAVVLSVATVDGTPLFRLTPPTIKELPSSSSITAFGETLKDTAVKVINKVVSPFKQTTSSDKPSPAPAENHKPGDVVGQKPVDVAGQKQGDVAGCQKPGSVVDQKPVDVAGQKQGSVVDQKPVDITGQKQGMNSDNDQKQGDDGIDIRFKDPTPASSKGDQPSNPKLEQKTQDRNLINTGAKCPDGQKMNPDRVCVSDRADFVD